MYPSSFYRTRGLGIVHDVMLSYIMSWYKNSLNLFKFWTFKQSHLLHISWTQSTAVQQSTQWSQNLFSVTNSKLVFTRDYNCSEFWYKCGRQTSYTHKIAVLLRYIMKINWPTGADQGVEDQDSAGSDIWTVQQRSCCDPRRQAAVGFLIGPSTSLKLSIFPMNPW